LIESETSLVSRCQAGDTEAFRALVEKYSRVLFGTAYLMTRDRGLAEDAVQGVPRTDVEKAAFPAPA
jgi:DNA-directed RNA polymerase specialized sigma24 family protein